MVPSYRRGRFRCWRVGKRGGGRLRKGQMCSLRAKAVGACIPGMLPAPLEPAQGQGPQPCVRPPRTVPPSLSSHPIPATFQLHNAGPAVLARFLYLGFLACKAGKVVVTSPVEPS